MNKSTLKNVETDNLISNLRGEVGEIIQSWTLMRDFYIISNELSCGDSLQDLKNQEFNKINLIKKKFKDEITSRLSELSHKSNGKVNFYFATNKLKSFESDFKDFEKYILDNHFKTNRDEYISHKKLPPTWNEQKSEHRINYLTILKGVAKALILMK
ncbi:MAG: hypothetical protein QNK30_14555 [Bacteroidales bacterium]|nr:hypothetical protein [Bacteroidales bacterium]